MRKLFIVLTGGAIILAGCGGGSSGEPNGNSSEQDAGTVSISVAELARMQSYVDTRIEAASVRHSFHSSEGFIDCVLTERQPSMLTAAMTGVHVSKPPVLPADQLVDMSPSLDRPQPGHFASEYYANDLDENGQVQHCDEGTVPIRCITMEEVTRYPSLEQFLRPTSKQISNQALTDPPDVFPTGPGAGFIYATARQKVMNFGIQSTLSLWDPYVPSHGHSVDDEHSVSQVWVSANGNQSTAEAGFVVEPGYYQTEQLHLSIYWTADHYQHTGCRDQQCAGFVQVSSSMLVGSGVAPVSTPGGSQYEFRLLLEVFPDGPYLRNWWLMIGNTWVGYWPTTLYPQNPNSLWAKSDTLTWGGEVLNSELGGVFTSADMGSGAWATASHPNTSASQVGWGYSGYHRNVQYEDLVNVIHPVTVQSAEVTDRQCYDYFSSSNTTGDGQYMFFGGPGYSVSCQ